MGIDLNLAIGTVLTFLAIPALASAWADRRFPLAGIVTLVIGLGLILRIALSAHGEWPVTQASATDFATQTVPQTLAMIPDAFIRLAGEVYHFFL